MFEASCHCGNVKLKVATLPESLTTCTCSTCHRYGAQWAYYLPEEVELEYDANVVASYEWGDRDLSFQHCRTCGCMTHYVTKPHYDKPKVAINARMFPRKDTQDLKIRLFDGADTWKFLN